MRDNLRTSDLGISVEVLIDNMHKLEELYRTLINNADSSATVIRGVLEIIDSVADSYAEETGYKTPVLADYL